MHSSFFGCNSIENARVGFPEAHKAFEAAQQQRGDRCERNAERGGYIRREWEMESYREGESGREREREIDRLRERCYDDKRDSFSYEGRSR